MKANHQNKKWGKRFNSAFVGLILIILVVFLGWWAIESYKLNNKINAIRAAGEPILPGDFHSDSEAINSATHLIAAADLLQQNDATWKQFDELDLGLPLKPNEIESIQTIVTRSAPALDHLQTAQQHSLNSWPLYFPAAGNPMDAILHELNPIRSLADVLMSDALLEHQRGNEPAALHRINQIIFIGDALDHHPTLIGHLIGIGCQAIAAYRLEEIACDLQIGSQPTDASPQEIRRMIQMLLDDQPNQKGFAQSMRGERAINLFMLRTMFGGTQSSIGRYLDRPIIDHNARLIIDYESQLIALADAPNLPQARAKMPADIPGPMPLTFFAQMVTAGLQPSVQTHFRVLVERHLAACALAIRWYAIDHHGQLPPTLDALVPNYLSTSPADLLTGDSHPIRYLPRKENPIIYSVGENGADDGGSEEPTKPSPRTGQAMGEWGTKDRVVHLTRQPRPAKEKDTDQTAPATTQSSSAGSKTS